MIVHGTADEFVSYQNAIFNTHQWANIHGINWVKTDLKGESINKQLNFKNKKGETVLSLFSLAGRTHGYPIDPDNGCGEVGKFIIDTRVCAAEKITDFFGL